jgi:hypothetical protein
MGIHARVGFARGILATIVAAGTIGAACAGLETATENAPPVTAAGPGLSIPAENLETKVSALSTPTQAAFVVNLGAGAGASCDGVAFTDHASALQACIDNANASGGGTVTVKAGTYASGTWPLAVKSHVTLSGEGPASVTFAPTASQIIGSVADNSTIRGLVFDLTNVSQGAIRFGALAGPHNNVRIEDNLFRSVQVTAGTYYGIYSVTGANAFASIFIRGNSAQISGSTFSVFNPVSLQVTSGSGTIENVRVESNDFFLNSAMQGAFVTLNAASSTFASSGIVVSGNTMRSLASSIPTGISVTGGYDVQVTGNAIAALTNTVLLAPGAATNCSATITGNMMKFGATSLGTCAANSVVAANSNNQSGARVGKASVAVRAYRSGSQNFTAGTAATLLFNVEDADNGANFDVTTGTFTAPAAGLYRARACARISTTNFASGDTADVALNVGGATWAFGRIGATGGTQFTSCVDDLVVMAKGATLQATVNASGTANTRSVSGSGRYSTYLNIQQISD